MPGSGDVADGLTCRAPDRFGVASERLGDHPRDACCGRTPSVSTDDRLTLAHVSSSQKRGRRRPSRPLVVPWERGGRCSHRARFAGKQHRLGMSGSSRHAAPIREIGSPTCQTRARKRARQLGGPADLSGGRRHAASEACPRSSPPASEAHAEARSVADASIGPPFVATHTPPKLKGRRNGSTRWRRLPLRHAENERCRRRDGHEAPAGEPPDHTDHVGQRGGAAREHVAPRAVPGFRTATCAAATSRTSTTGNSPGGTIGTRPAAPSARRSLPHRGAGHAVPRPSRDT